MRSDDSGFIQECNECHECKWKALSSGLQRSVGGGGHLEKECIEACYSNDDCNFVSRSSTGYCHLSQHCIEKGDFGWSRFRRKTYEGMPQLLITN